LAFMPLRGYSRVRGMRTRITLGSFRVCKASLRRRGLGLRSSLAVMPLVRQPRMRGLETRISMCSRHVSRVPGSSFLPSGLRFLLVVGWSSGTSFCWPSRAIHKPLLFGYSRWLRLSLSSGPCGTPG
jgi:hypothetical protein